LKWVLWGLILAHIVMGWIVVSTNYQSVFEPRTIPEHQQKWQVNPGTGLRQVLSELSDAELAPDPIWMMLAMKVRDQDWVVKKGTYRLDASMSAWDIMEMLHHGDVLRISITIPEGLEKWEVAALLGQSEFGSEETFQELINRPESIRDMDPEADDLEGYLLPETYSFEYGSNAKTVIETMLSQFRKDILPHREKAREMGLSMREWVTLASMIEKETAEPSERHRIAGVFMNRRQRGIPYQCDPTIVYGLKRDGRYRGKIYLSDLKYESPYNTYVVPGLPPGPIASPGKASLLAVLDYERHSFLYFVSKNNGTHHFSTSLREHNRYVRKYQR